MWRSWRIRSYKLNMILSTGASACISYLILTTFLPPTNAESSSNANPSAPAQIASSSSAEVFKAHSIYGDVASDPTFPWSYARVKRQLYREHIPHHRPLSGNLYAEHAGFPHPGRWFPRPGSILRPNPNSGHHFDDPNVILTEADFQRYGSTLQHLEKHGHGHGYGHGGGGHPRPIALGPGYSHGNEYGAPSGPSGPSGPGDNKIVHHEDGDLPVRILHHHHWHPPIIAEPISHPIPPHDQGKLVEFKSIGNELGKEEVLVAPEGHVGHGGQQLIVPEGGHAHAHAHGHGGPVAGHGHVGQLLVPGGAYGHGGFGQQLLIAGGHGGHGGHGGGQVLIAGGGHGAHGHAHAHAHAHAPIAQDGPFVPIAPPHQHAIPVPLVQKVVEQVPVHQVQEEVHVGGEELGHKFPIYAQGHAHAHAHAQPHAHEIDHAHAHGHGHPHPHGGDHEHASHLASLKNKPLSHLFNFHNMIFGPSRRPTHHTPILKGLWPSAYGKWRHRPFSWSFSY